MSIITTVPWTHVLTKIKIQVGMARKVYKNKQSNKIQPIQVGLLFLANILAPHENV